MSMCRPQRGLSVTVRVFNIALVVVGLMLSTISDKQSRLETLLLLLLLVGEELFCWSKPVEKAKRFH